MECPSCKFVAAPGQAAEDGATCPNCQRPYRSQPSPLQSDMAMRNMPAPGEEDMGGNPLQEGILGDYQNRGVRDESYASVQEPDVEIPAEVTEVIPPDPKSIRPDKKRMDRKAGPEMLAALPLVGEALSGEGAVGSMMGMAMGPAAGPLSLAKSFLPGGGGGSAPAPQQAPMPMAEPSYYSRTHTDLRDSILQTFAADEELKSPSSIDNVLDEEHDYDTKQKDEGERDKDLQVGQGVNDLGGTDQGAFDPKGQGMQLFQELLPLVLQFATSDNPGEENPDLQRLHQALDQERPGYLDRKDDEQGHHLLMMIVNGKGDEGGQQDNDEPHDPLADKKGSIDPHVQSTCLFCGGALDPSTGHCPQCALGNPKGNPQPINTNQSPVLAGTDDTQGPRTDEQRAAVAELLLGEGRQDEIPQMILQPQDYADELSKITQQDAPPEMPEQSQPPPMAPEEQAQSMPVPGMSAPGPASTGMPGMMASIFRYASTVDSLADNCPECDSHSTGYLNEDGKCGCKTCGHEWSSDELTGEGHRTADAFDDWDDDDFGGRDQFRDPGGNSALRAGNPVHPCPTCGTPEQLTDEDVARGYQCDRCADEAEGRYGKTADEHVQQHHDNFGNGLGVDAADTIHQRDIEKEQDSSHTWADDHGEPLKVGSEYEMYSDKYDIPDMVRIEAVKPDSIEYTLTGEYGLEHQTEVSYEEANIENLHFVPAHGEAELAGEEPGLEENQDDIGRPGVGSDQTDLSSPHMRMTHREGNSFGFPMEDEDTLNMYTGQPMGDESKARLNEMLYDDDRACPQCGDALAGDAYDQASQCPNCGWDSLDAIEPPDQTEQFEQAQQRGVSNPYRGSSVGPDWLRDEMPKTAGAKLTPQEQREFIEEEGAARNAEKLDLAGTHYESATEAEEAHFLWY